jgi:hypothetical protein
MSFEVVKLVSKFMIFGIRRHIVWYICPTIQGILCQKNLNLKIVLYINVNTHKIIVHFVASTQNQCIPVDFTLSVIGADLHLATQPLFV